MLEAIFVVILLFATLLIIAMDPVICLTVISILAGICVYKKIQHN